jgi:ATP-dependent Lon protease
MEEELQPVPAPAPPELPIERLRWRCSPEVFSFRSTDEILACEEIIGQQRAVDAIRQGLEIKSPGYNIFVAGLTGTGKVTTIKQILEEIDRSTTVPGDKCYVNNFRDPDRPIYLSLPPGRGKELCLEMKELVESLKRDLPRLFDSETFKKRRQSILEGFSDREQKMVKELEAGLKEQNFALIRVEMGPVSKPEVAYVVGDEPVRMEELGAKAPDLKEEEVEEIRKQYQELAGQLGEALKKSRDMAREARRAVKRLQNEFARQVTDGLIDDLQDSYAEHPKVKDYLEEVKTHVLENLGLFEPPEEEEESEAAERFRDYAVNVIVDNSKTRGAPIVIETAPTHKNLFGSIERTVNGGPGTGSSDFMMIKGGSILEADGGYLVFNLLDAAQEPTVWPALKRTLKNSSLNIQSHDAFQFFSGSSLKPEPIDLNLKVVVVGDHMLYHLLYNYEEEFPKIFKVKAEFDSLMPRDAEVIEKYARFICKICNEEKLKPFDPSGVAAVVEETVRLTGRSDKISTRFSDVADLIREAAYWAARSPSELVKVEHVDRAVEARKKRVDLMEQRIREMFVDGTVLIGTQGEEVGTVNGLSIYDSGDHVFGQPTRITAQTAMGRGGIINIEREAELSGKTHNKGVFILEGYLRSRYAQDKPLSVSASICFEQSYSSVDGDSASSTEIYALLSSLSGIAIRQNLAVTGSVNQRGEIQPIGGVNEKIEGFFDVCTLRGLKGNEGVLIPALNQTDLMLRKDVVEAVAAGRFHIYPVRTVDEGIEILTGIKSGERDADGNYPEGTLNFLTDERLADLAEGLREFGEAESHEDGEGQEERD